jgi:hypothetical protein
MKKATCKKKKSLDNFNEKYRELTLNLLRACRNEPNFLTPKDFVIPGHFKYRVENFRL